MQLDGRVAFITGAGSGIGAATARYMAQLGGSIAVVGIPGDSVQKEAEELTSAGHNAIGIPTDVSKPDEVERAVKQTVEQFGHLDILVPNAGVQLHDRDRDLHELPEEVWDETMGINLRGVFLVCKYGLKQMVSQESGGAVVIVSSITALNGASGNPAYMTSKGALLHLGQHIAVHYARHGIRCNTICPGALERTPNHDLLPDAEGRKQRLEATIPLGRLGAPEDIAPTIAFLASDEARYATGANYVVDGGRTVV